MCAGIMHMCLYLSLVLSSGFSLAKPKKPVAELPPAQNVNINQMSGKWYLLSVASRCKYLLEHGLKVEGTIITLTAPASPKAPIKVSTFTKLNFECWEIKQQYEATSSQGRFLLKGKRPENNIDVVVLDTDYNSYAILLYKKYNKLTLKLYGRSPEIAEDIVDKFEDIAKKQNLGLDVVFQFPTYGFCQSADKEHTLGKSGTFPVNTAPIMTRKELFTPLGD